MSNENFKVYVVGGGFDYIRMLYAMSYDGAKGLDDADIVLFTGGEDVNPELYGEVPMAKTHFNRLRDDKEKAIYEEALKRELPMVGICRGGQFLNVMNDGKMWQHVNCHTLAGSHLAYVQVAPFKGEGKNKKPRVVNVTSTHHQMMIPAKHGMVLLTAMESFEKNSPAYVKIGKDKDMPDIEAVFYDDTNCLCFQPHPEFQHATADCVDLFEEFMDNFIVPRIPLKGSTPTEKAIVDQVPKGKKAASKKKGK